MASRRVHILPRVITALVVFLFVPDSRAVQCPPDWRSYPGDVCLKYFDVATNFAHAYEICQTEGASLASVSNIYVSNFVWAKLFNTRNPYWVTAKNLSAAYSVKGAIQQHEWPLEVPFDHHGEGQTCVKMKNDDGGFERDDCNVMLPYYCEIYVGNQMVCPNHWKLYFRENTCVGFFGLPQTFHKATHRCSSQGGSLVKIWNKEKEHFVTDLTPSWPNAAWVGISKAKGQRKFKFADGKELVIQKPKSWTIGDVAGGRDDATCMVVGKNARGLEKRYCDEKHFYFCANTMARCLAPWKKIPGSKVCVRELRESLTFKNARNDCLKSGGDLPIIQTQTRLEFIRERVRTDNQTEYWIFNNDLDADGMWDGEYKFPPTPNLPDGYNPGFDNCVSILAETGQMKRVGCESRFFFICERDMDINFECPENWTPYHLDKTCFRRMEEQPKSYREARALCKTFHRDLIAIDSDQKKKAVENAIKYQHRHFPLWVGYYKDLAFTSLASDPSQFSWEMPMRLVRFEKYILQCILAEWEPNTYRGSNCHIKYYFVCEKHEPSGHRHACDEGWTMYLREKVCVKVMDHSKLTFWEAMPECNRLGGRVAHVWNDEKNLFIKEIYPASFSRIRQPVWIFMLNFFGSLMASGGTKIKPIDPKTITWPDMEVLNVMYANTESTDYQSCLTLGHRGTGIVQSSCEAEHYPICENPLVEGYQSCTGPGFLFANESTCVKLYRDKMTWFEAFNLCKISQGNLVEIASMEKLNFILNFRGLKSLESHWIGMRDIDFDGSFEYVSGFKFFPLAPAFRQWKSPFEPDNRNKCLRTDGQTVGYQARHCDSKYFFICQKDK